VHFEKQLLTSPLWLRDDEDAEFSILEKDEAKPFVGSLINIITSSDTKDEPS